MNIEDMRIGQQVIVDTPYCKGPATIVGINLEGLTSTVIARFCDPVESFKERATERIIVITPSGEAFTGINSTQVSQS